MPRLDRGKNFPIAGGVMVGRMESRVSDCGLHYLTDRLA